MVVLGSLRQLARTRSILATNSAGQLRVNNMSSKKVIVTRIDKSPGIEVLGFISKAITNCKK